MTEHPDPGSAVRRQLTSWNTTKSIVDEPNSELSGPGMGRAGYSVRFVAFKNLLEGKIGTNDGNFDYQSPFDRVTGGTDSANLLQELEAIAH